MLPKSNDFHIAVLRRNPEERALLVFSDENAGPVPSLISTRMAWTGDDIVASSGLRVVESINSGQELAIGQAVSSTAQVSIFNDHGLLNDYTAQLALDKECRIYLGVKVNSEQNSTVGLDGANCVGYLKYADGVKMPVAGYSTEPYLTIGGEPVTHEFLDFPVHGLLIEEGETYAQIIAIGQYAVGDTTSKYIGFRWNYGVTWGQVGTQTWGAVSNYDWGTLFGSYEVSTPAMSPYMYLKTFPTVSSRNLAFMFDGTTVYESHADGTVDTWDYAPLGVFNFDKPSQRDQFIIPFTAYDRMTLFDADVGEWLAGLTFPMTLFEFLDSLCSEVGVPNAMQSTSTAILNASLVISEKPDYGSHPTGRTILRSIAEASGTNARMDREGRLELVAINDDPVYVINPNPAYPDPHAVYDTQIATFECAEIDKLSIDIPTDDGNATVSVGTGDNAYILSANPLLRNADATVTETRITPIYTRLAALDAYTPTTIRCTCDWSVQAGDTVNLWYIPAGGSGYAGRVTIPVFTQTILFTGGAVVEYENHGNPMRTQSDYIAYAASSQTVSEFSQIGDEIGNMLPRTGVAYRTASIPFGVLDGTSTSTVMTASVDGVTELRDGVCMFLRNGVVTSASGVTLNINGLGAKPIYQTMAAATAVTTTFNAGYTMLFVYNSSRVSGGCWDMYYGYNSDNNTLAYNVRRYQSDGVMHSQLYRYEIVFTMRNGELEPANNVSNKPTTTTKALTTQAWDPHRPIYYYSTTTAVSAGASPSATYMYIQYGTVDLRYGFNANATLTAKEDVYIKCIPQADGTVKLSGNNCIAQALPTVADGYVYLYLGRAYSTTQITLDINHPMYAIIGGVCKPWHGETVDAAAS